MKNFVKLIKQVHEERFVVALNKIVTKKIPVAFLSVAPINQAVDMVNNFCKEGLNIKTLFVIDSPPSESL